MRRLVRRVRDFVRGEEAALRGQLDLILETIGQQEIRRLQDAQLPHIRDYGVRVFSQFDADGIIAHLLRQIPDAPRTFVEFGVGDYRESNTRLLIRNGDWRGVIIEADPGSCERIRELEESWRFDLRLVDAFVTRENINNLIADAGFAGDIGILSIDIDGNDYWVWQAITVVRPVIVVIEFNARFGPDRSVTIPYDPAFSRIAASHTGVYFGASLAAMVKLGTAKGYDYVGSDVADINAFFVCSELRPETLPALTASEGFRPLRVREMRDSEGALTFAGRDVEDEVLAGMPLVEI
jgi:hypothetical protein